MKIQQLKVTVNSNTLSFGSDVRIEFHRTLRIPDDGKIYPLPPSLGLFPICKVDDYIDRVPLTWRQHGGVFIPMYQREAMWIKFNASNEPKAVKVAVGKVNAISGKQWDQRLKKDENDYIVIPDQPWLDGINAGDGHIKQFVAMPLGSGTTVEGQVTGKEEFGGIQLIVYAAKPNKFPKFGFDTFDSFTGFNQSWGSGFGSTQAFSFGSSNTICQQKTMDSNSFGFGSSQKFSFGSQPKEMGLSAGGKMKQKIYKDKYGVDTWDENNYGRVYVHIVNSATYKQITGREPPSTPIDAKMYSLYGYKWYDIYDEDKEGIKKSTILQNVKSVKELELEKSIFATPDETVFIPGSQVHTMNPKQEKTGFTFSTSRPTHNGVTCDGCKTFPIVGVRYKCLQCPDFDFCEKCENSNYHDQTHVFMKIKVPLPKQLPKNFALPNFYAQTNFDFHPPTFQAPNFNSQTDMWMKPSSEKCDDPFSFA